MSPAIWNHTVSPATRHKLTHPALTPTRQTGTVLNMCLPTAIHHSSWWCTITDNR